MRRTARWMGISLAGIVLLLISLLLFVKANTFRPAVEANCGNALGTQVTVGDLRSQFSPRV